MQGKMIDFARPDGKSASGYLALPDDGDGAPAVVLVHELWGLNDQMKGVANRIAKAGFRALVPDLFRGKVAATKDEGRQLMSELDRRDATSQDLRGAVQHLKSRAPNGKVAVLGFCMGGALTIVACVALPEPDAGVCFYGIPPAEAADPARIRVPMQFHFAKQDQWCSPEVVGKLEETLRRGNVAYELYSYEGQHAFMNEMRADAHDPAAAKIAWERAVKFLNEKLR
jgi:carboxymethylenebutenolidase